MSVKSQWKDEATAILVLLLILLGDAADINSAYCDTCYRSVVCPSVCMSSVTLEHLAKAVGQNEMPFGRDTRVVSRYIMLDRGPDPPREVEIWGQNPQFAAMPPVAKLL